MPKGPNGQKRPADAIGCAVRVARIATGEDAEEVAYAASMAKRGSAGGKARAQRLSTGERQSIAKAGAEARWSKERRADMTDQTRLMRALFEHAGRTHVDIKFLRGSATNITREQVCHEAVNALFQIDNGLIDSVSFEEDFKQVDVAELVKAL